MSDETYYTVLNVKETASASEIKTAYRDLIKKVHPDTITNLAPYLKKIAEDKAKDAIEAYTVLSSATKRRDYDRQLAEYRRQTMPPAPPGPKTTPPPAATSATSPPRPTRAATSHASRPRPQAVRWLGYNWAPLMRWSREHPLVVFTVLFSVVFIIASLFSDANTPQSQANTSQSLFSGANTPQSQASPSQFTGNNPSSFTNKFVSASPGPYSQYPCDLREKISPIDGKPCSFSVSLTGSDPQRQDQSVPATPPGVQRTSATPVTTAPNMQSKTASTRKAAPENHYVIVGEEDVEDAGTAKNKPVIDFRKKPVIDLRSNSNSTAKSEVKPESDEIPKPPAETRAGPRQPDLFGLTPSERQSIEAACSQEKYLEGSAAYDQCLVHQVQALTKYRQ
jgi:hypothetical protein